MLNLVTGYDVPDTHVLDGKKQLALPPYPVVFFALGDAPGAISTDAANDLMVRALEALEHPRAAELRAELELDPDEYLPNYEQRRYALYDTLEPLMEEIAPPGFVPLYGGYIVDEGSWFGWGPVTPWVKP